MNECRNALLPETEKNNNDPSVYVPNQGKRHGRTVHTHIIIHKVAGPNGSAGAALNNPEKREKSVDVETAATRTSSLVGMMTRAKWEVGESQR